MEGFTDPTVWASLQMHTLYGYREQSGVYPRDLNHADEVYSPSDWIPKYLAVRTSSSSKRLDKGISLDEVTSPCPSSVRLFEVRCSGAQIGVVIEPAQDTFCQSYFTPDGCLLLTGEELDNAITKDGYEYKTMRLYLIGDGNDDPASSSHDCLVTAKKRWFRNRNDPKFLGFSKDR